MTAWSVGLWFGAAAWLALVPVGRVPEAVARADGPGRLARLGGLGRRLWCRVRTRRGAADTEHVRVAVAQVTALLRAGSPPGAAWPRALGVSVDALGAPEEACLARAVGGQAHARTIIAASRVAHELGAPLGGVLEAVSDALVVEAEARSEREAALAGPQTTARVLLWLPAAGVVLGWVLGADPLATALDGGAGTGAIGLGLALLAVGRAWTARMITNARSAGEATP